MSCRSEGERLDRHSHLSLEINRETLVLGRERVGGRGSLRGDLGGRHGKVRKCLFGRESERERAGKAVRTTESELMDESE
jgi:hypothetical protein